MNEGIHLDLDTWIVPDFRGFRGFIESGVLTFA